MSTTQNLRKALEQILAKLADLHVSVGNGRVMEAYEIARAALADHKAAYDDPHGVVGSQTYTADLSDAYRERDAERARAERAEAEVKILSDREFTDHLGEPVVTSNAAYQEILHQRDEIAAMEARAERLREALEPFAALLDDWPRFSSVYDNRPMPIATLRLSFESVERAATALDRKEPSR